MGKIKEDIMNGHAEFIGSFKVTSGSIIVSDPCYGMSIVYEGTHAAKLDAKNGTWVGEIVLHQGRVSRLVCYHKKHGLYKVGLKLADFEVAVDSGQAGVFDSESYRNDETVKDWPESDRLYEDVICPEEPWYSWCCDRTCSEDQAGAVPNGVVSSTAWGDGCYKCEIAKEEDVVVAVSIDFYYEDEDDNDDDWC
jgi:hypothetical protein